MHGAFDFDQATEKVLYERANQFSDSHFFGTKKILWLACIWPFMNFYGKIIGRFLISSSIAIFLISSILKFLKVLFYNTNSNQNNLVEIILQIVALAAILMSYCIMVIKEKQVKQVIYSQLFKLDELKPDEKVLLYKIIRYIYLFALFQTVLVTLLMATYGLAPVVVPSILLNILSGNHTYVKHLPMQTEFFLDENQYFGTLFIAQLFTLLNFSLALNALNIFQWCGVAYIITLLRCLVYQMQKLKDLNSFNQDLIVKNEISEIMSNEVTDMIKNHQHVIEIMELFNEIASPLMIVVLLLSSMCLVISAFWMVILSKTDKAEAFRMFCAFYLIAISLFFICLPSQLVVDSNTHVYNSCYGCNWYDYPKKTRKMFQMFILRLSKTLVVPAGPLAKLNFEMYGKIMKTSLSYTTALMSIYI